MLMNSRSRDVNPICFYRGNGLRKRERERERERESERGRGREMMLMTPVAIQDWNEPSNSEWPLLSSHSSRFSQHTAYHSIRHETNRSSDA